jgi:predicted nucleic acid-binding protein
MAARLFVDSSGWYALIDRRDAWHESAKEQIERHVRKRARLITSDYVIDESCTLTKVRAGSVAAVRFLDLLKESQAVDWEWIGAERFARAEALFRKRRDQGYSFTDCTSFALMQELRIDRALTSDAHFRAAGFHPTLV